MGVQVTLRPDANNAGGRPVTPTLVLTRAPADSERFIARIGAEARVASIISPAFDIVPVPARIDTPPAHVVFTSVRGVAQAERFDLGGARAWCVGARTTEAARAAGFDATDGGGDVERLAATLIAAGPEGRILHLRGRHVAGDLVGALTAAGLDAGEVICYTQEPRAPSATLRDAMGGPGPLIMPLFSPRAALLLAGLEGPAPLHVIAMSPAVAGVIEGFAVETVTTATQPTEDAMVAATLARIRKLNAIGST